MTGEGSSSPLPRLALIAGRAFLVAFAVACSVVWGAVVLVAGVVLHIARPLLFYPLLLVTVGGLGFAAAFAVTGKWELAGQTLAVGLVTGTLLGLFAVLAQKVDPAYFDNDNRGPPWWWSL